MPARTATALKCLVCIARCQCLVSRILLNSRFIKILSNNTPDTDKLTSFFCWKAKLSMLRMHPRDTPVPLLISKEGPGATCKQLLLFRHVYRNAWIVHFLCGVSFKSHHLFYLRLFETPCKIAGPLNNVRVLLDLNMQGGHCTTSKLGRQRCNGGTHVTCTIRCGSPHSLLWVDMFPPQVVPAPGTLFVLATFESIRPMSLWTFREQSGMDTYIELSTGLTSNTVYCLRFFCIFIFGHWQRLTVSMTIWLADLYSPIVLHKVMWNLPCLRWT